MSSLLDWSPAKRGDRDELRTFACTEDGRKERRAGRWELVHPRPWERIVQARIRTMGTPCQPPTYAVLGRDEEGLGAVVCYDELDGAGQVEILVAAVALRYRQRGGGWADEMMKTLLDELTLKALDTGVDLIELGTWVHEQNRGSQRLCRQYGLRQTAQGKDGLQRWASTLLVGGADFS